MPRNSTAGDDLNHLAHLLLAEPTPEGRLGGLIADFIRPVEFDALHPEVKRGVRQHRFVDSFTDSHPAIGRSILRLSAEWGWFSGIIVDVYADYLLSLAWGMYCDVPLRAFVDGLNRDLLAVADLAPPNAKVSVHRIASTDRLASYVSVEGVRAALVRLTGIIAHRMPTRARDLTLALPLLASEYDALADDFAEFFPSVVKAAGEWEK